MIAISLKGNYNSFYIFNNSHLAISTYSHDTWGYEGITQGMIQAAVTIFLAFFCCFQTFFIWHRSVAATRVANFKQSEMLHLNF